jgi:hypothetical protein
MSWVIPAFAAAGIALIIYGYVIIGRADSADEDLNSLPPILLSAVCLLVAFLLWGGRWLWHAAEPWLLVALSYLQHL